MTLEIEFLWFAGCANHVAARRLLDEVVADLAPGVTVRDIDASEPLVATRLRFAGSPTIRVDGIDVDPSFIDPGEYTPRCRLYRTDAGLAGVSERRWIEAALSRR